LKKKKPQHRTKLKRGQDPKLYINPNFKFGKKQLTRFPPRGGKKAKKKTEGGVRKKKSPRGEKKGGRQCKVTIHRLDAALLGIHLNKEKDEAPSPYAKGTWKTTYDKKAEG